MVASRHGVLSRGTLETARTVFWKLTRNMDGVHWELYWFRRTAKYVLKESKGTENMNIRTSRENKVIKGIATDDFRPK